MNTMTLPAETLAPALQQAPLRKVERRGDAIITIPQRELMSAPSLGDWCVNPETGNREVFGKAGWELMTSPEPKKNFGPDVSQFILGEDATLDDVEKQLKNLQQKKIADLAIKKCEYVQHPDVQPHITFIKASDEGESDRSIEGLVFTSEESKEIFDFIGKVLGRRQ